MAEPWSLGPVVVTGGTGHIGRAVVRTFHEVGAVTVAVGGNVERTKAAAAEMRALANVHVLCADVSEPTTARRLLDDVTGRFGAPAVLVNGAGINFNRMIKDVTPDEFDRLFRVNVRALFFTSRYACDRMVAAGIRGRVVNITSGNYRYARPDGGLYSATKSAAEMLTRSFALEYGPDGIAVNAVAPGLVDRPGFTGPEFLAIAAYYREQSTQHALATTQDIADTVFFLASNTAAHVAGETIVVDGGFSAGRLDFPRRSS